jgi:hypothetical protein
MGNVAPTSAARCGFCWAADSLAITRVPCVRRHTLDVSVLTQRLGRLRPHPRLQQLDRSARRWKGHCPGRNRQRATRSQSPATPPATMKQGVHFGTVRGDTYTACSAITGNPLATSGADGVWRWRRRISTLMPVYTGSATDTSESRAS